MERGYIGHCSCNLNGTLYDEALRVPLIMHYPVVLPKGKRIRDQVSHIDMMPTVFDLLGLPMPDSVEGQSVLPLLEGRADTFRPEAFAETTPAGWQALHNDDREIWCVRTNDWKLILNTHGERTERRYELYDLVSDPGETNNVFDEAHGVARELRAKLDAYVGRAVAAR